MLIQNDLAFSRMRIIDFDVIEVGPAVAEHQTRDYLQRFVFINILYVYLCKNSSLLNFLTNTGILIMPQTYQNQFEDSQLTN